MFWLEIPVQDTPSMTKRNRIKELMKKMAGDALCHWAFTLADAVLRHEKVIESDVGEREKHIHFIF